MTEIKVTFTTKCDLTGKELTREFSSVDAIRDAQLVTQEKTKAAEEVHKFFRALGEFPPDLVIFYNGQLRTFGTVHPKQENRINRAITQIIGEDPDFPVTRRTRKSKKD